MSDAGEKPVVEEQDDFGGDVRRAVEELKVAAPAETKVTLDKPADTRARGDDGKFVEAPKEEKPKRATLTVPDPKVAGVVPPAPEAQLGVPAPASFKAPDGWKAELKAKFPELPPEIQAEISRRESDTHKALTKQDEERTFGKRISEIVMPYLPTIRQEGGTAEKAVEQLLQTAHTLRQGDDFQKARAVAAVIQQFKVSPQALFSVLQGNSVVPGGNVQQGQFNPVIESLQQRIDRMEQERQQETQQRQLQEQSSLQGQIEEFASKPGHEHFEQVRTLMGTLLESGVAKDLDDAYERAIYSDPDIRSSLIAATTQADQGKRLTEQQAKTERARSAAVSVTGSPGGAKPNGHAGSVGSIEDDLRAAMREHQGRV